MTMKDAGNRTLFVFRRTEYRLYVPIASLFWAQCHVGVALLLCVDIIIEPVFLFWPNHFTYPRRTATL